MRYLRIPILFFFIPFLVQANDQIAKTLLKADLATFTRPLNRDIYVYSHRNAAQLDVDNLESPEKEAINGLKEYQELAKEHQRFDRGMVGQGLYASSDPFTSATYGKFNNLIQLSNWVMSRIKIPSKTNILDLRMPGGGWEIPLSEATISALKEHCPSLKNNHSAIQADKVDPENYPINRVWKGTISSHVVDGKRWFFTPKAILTKDKNCHKLFSDILKELNVDTIAYKWGGHSPSECEGKRANQETAFVLVNNKLNEGNIDIFTKNPPQGEAKSEARKIHYMVERHYRTGIPSKRWSNFSSNKVRWDEYEDEEIGLKEDVALSQYMQETKFGCGKKYEEEDNFKYFPENGAKVLMEELPLHLSIKVTPCLLEKTHYGPRPGN